MRELTWKQLCQEIMTEEDPVKLFALADALSRALDEPKARVMDPRCDEPAVAIV